MSFTMEKHAGLEVDEVKVAKRNKKKHFQCHELLPQPPFLLLMSAPRYSGKTNLCIKMLIDKEMYCNKFDEIFIWSKSYHNDPKWKNIYFDEEYEKEHIFSTYDEAFAQSLFESIQERSKNEQVETLFIFDDMIGDEILKPQRVQMLDRIAATGRHFDISAIIIFQKFKKFSSIVRENATNVVIFEQKNATAIEQIMDEYKGDMDKKDFMKIYHTVCSEPFQFLHINLQVPAEIRFRKGWNTIIHYHGGNDDGTDERPTKPVVKLPRRR